jgi:hypothetical protein
VIFQCLEKWARPEVKPCLPAGREALTSGRAFFPIIGKKSKKFSNVWKKRD